MVSVRPVFVMLHRWAGLTIALFVAVAGLTGSLLAFNFELEGLTAPGVVSVAPPAPDARRLDPLVLRERALAASGGVIDYVRLDTYPGRTMFYYPKPRPGAPALDYDELRINPYTGAVAAQRWRGDLSQGWHNIMPFLYRLHYQLALGEWGELAFGIAALIWAIDCFVGLYLTLPVARANWWQRWRKAWTIRRPLKFHYKLNVDLHLANGLWLWPMLFVFAWSAVSFNLPRVHDPVMTALVGPSADQAAAPPLPQPLSQPRYSWQQARERGRALAIGLGRAQGFTVEADMNLGIDRKTGLWRYGFRSSREVMDRYGQSAVTFRDGSGELVNLSLPSGQTRRDTIDNWFVALHIGYVFGLPYRLFVSLMGLAVTLLGVTGIIIWTRKRSARVLRQFRSQPLPQARLTTARP